MDTVARLPVICFALVASLPGVSAAAGSADNSNRALCRERALAEGLRSEEVILDYMFECMESQSAANASSVPSDAAASTAQAPRRSHASQE